MSACAGCDHRTPIVSPRQAKLIASFVPEPLRSAVIDRCIAWLVTPTEGVGMATRALGRPYTRLEKDLLASELWRVERLPCPFDREGECLIRGCDAHADLRYDSTRNEWGWLPALLMRELALSRLQALIRLGVVPDAKTALLTRRGHFPIVDAANRDAPALAIAYR